MKRLGLVVLMFVASVVWAQGMPIPTVIQVTTPDGGLPVNLGSATVNTQVTTPDGGLPVTLGAQRVAVEATGPAGDPVAISGSTTTTLTQESIAALGPAPCIQGETRRLAVGATPIPVPPNFADGGVGALPARTGILLVNAGTVATQTISCRIDPGDAGVPDCTTPGYGLTVYPNGGSASFSARDNQWIRCVACTGTNLPLEYQEESCVR